MSRSWVSMRDAEPGDAGFLTDLWGPSMRRADVEQQATDVHRLLEETRACATQRIVVALHDGEPAGAVLLRLDTASPINLEPVLRVAAPSVLPRVRRHGVGRALMECAVAFAEEQGATSVGAAATAGSREANRFMARLGLSPSVTYRLAPTARVRSRLTSMRADLPSAHRTGRGVVLARRSMRRPETALPQPGVVGPPLT